MRHIHKECGQLCTITLITDGPTYTDVKCSACGKQITVHEYNDMSGEVEKVIGRNFRTISAKEAVLYPTQVEYALFDSGTKVTEE
jgi:hypothetical protein